MKIERVALAAVVLGALSWLAAPAFMDIGYDGNTYVATGHGWARTRELVLQWGDVLTFHPTGPGHSHHFPPAYPFYLGLVFSVFGYGYMQAKLAAVAASLVALAVVHFTTRDLYGPRKALLVSATFALSPWMLWITGMGFSESLATVFFVLTMWSIVKSLTDERFIVLAGLFAGLAYLSRASMGAFFVVAGLGGLSWRLYHRGFRATLTSPWYGAAILVFGAILAAWAYRNVALFGWPNWETSPGTRGIPRYIGEHLRAFVTGLAVRAPLLALPFAPALAFLWPEARRSIARIRDEHVSGLWLSVALIYLLGILFAAAYFSMGVSRHEALRLDNARYVLVGVVPLTWALLRESDVDAPRFQRRYVALLATLAVGMVLVATFPAQYLPSEAARALDPHVQEGDRIAVNGAGKYPFYGYLSEPEKIVVYTLGTIEGDDRPEFIFTFWREPHEGYTLVVSEEQRHWWWASQDEYLAVWARDDVVAARAITLEPLRPGW